MKIAFVVHNELFTSRVMQLLDAAGIDYYTRWEEVQGKGHGTEPHLGKGRHSRHEHRSDDRIPGRGPA